MEFKKREAFMSFLLTLLGFVLGVETSYGSEASVEIESHGRPIRNCSKRKIQRAFSATKPHGSGIAGLDMRRIERLEAQVTQVSDSLLALGPTLQQIIQLSSTAAASSSVPRLRFQLSRRLSHL